MNPEDMKPVPEIKGRVVQPDEPMPDEQAIAVLETIRMGNAQSDGDPINKIISDRALKAAIVALRRPYRTTCFHCGGKLIWDSDFDFEDFGFEGEGIVHVLHCSKCGANITYAVGEEE